MFLSALPARASAVQDCLARAQARYAARDDSGALAALHQARSADPSHLEAAWQEAYMMLVIANRSDDKSVRRAWLHQAVPRIDTLLRRHPESADAWFVGALALGVEASVASPRRRVELSKDMRGRIARALALDPDHPGAWYLLGRWHEGFASLNPVERGFVDLLLGGMPPGASLDSARLALERAAAGRPRDLQIHLDLVRVLVGLHQRDKARIVARKAIGFPLVSRGDEENRRSLEGLLREM